VVTHRQEGGGVDQRPAAPARLGGVDQRPQRDRIRVLEGAQPAGAAAPSEPDRRSVDDPIGPRGLGLPAVRLPHVAAHRLAADRSKPRSAFVASDEARDPVAPVAERPRKLAANEPACPGDEDPHFRPPPLKRYDGKGA
jgi:hypothetical protein